MRARAHVGPPGNVELDAVTFRGLEDGRDPFVECELDEVVVAHRLERDVDRRRAPIAGDDRLGVQGVVERADPQLGQACRIGRDLVDEAAELDELVSRIPVIRVDVDQTLGVAHAGQPADLVADRPQNSEVLRREDVLGLHRDHEDVVVAEVEDRALVDRFAGIVLGKHRLARSVHADAKAERIGANQRHRHAERHEREQAEHQTRMVDDPGRAKHGDECGQEQDRPAREGELERAQHAMSLNSARSRPPSFPERIESLGSPRGR